MYNVLFCGESQNNVRQLVKGNSAYICDECIYLCVGILEDGLTLSYEATEFFEKSNTKQYIDQESLIDEFMENKIAANSKYSNKSILILGNVKDIDRGNDGEERFLVTLGVSEASILCNFKIDYDYLIQKICKDELIIVEGTYFDYKAIGNQLTGNRFIKLIFKDCMIIGIKGRKGSLKNANNDINIIHALPPKTELNYSKNNIVLFKRASEVGWVE